MKRFLTSIIIALLGLNAFNGNAQVKEDFEGNSLNWQEYSSSKRTAVIKEGVLYLKASDDKRVFATCTAPIDCAESFRITAKFSQLKLGDDNKGISIIFNYSDDRNFDAFNLTNDNVSYIQLEKDNLARYRDADFKLNKKIKEHEIIIQYRNRKVELIVDDVQCLEASYVNMMYNGFGFGVFGSGQEASIDEVVFRQM